MPRKTSRFKVTKGPKKDSASRSKKSEIERIVSPEEDNMFHTVEKNTPVVSRRLPQSKRAGIISRTLDTSEEKEEPRTKKPPMARRGQKYESDDRDFPSFPQPPSD